METQGASLSLGRWSLWLLLLGLVVPSASAQALSYREAVLRAVGQLNERSSEANLYRLLELDPAPNDVDPGTRKPVSFTVKETVCPRTTQQPPEECDFKENGLVKQCVGTVTLDPSNDQFDINCNERSMRPLFLPGGHGGRQQPQDSIPTPGSLPSPSPTPALLLQHPVGRTETCCVCSAGGNAASAHVELTDGPRGVRLLTLLNTISGLSLHERRPEHSSSPWRS
uniref:Uncharacterized protein n=1 Tax=Capra hircus TaxID=9925 RepID=A0A452F973_CAPHI